MTHPSTSPSEALLQLITGFTRSQVVYVAAQLGLADLLAGGPRTGDDLAAAVGAHPPSLARLLRALVSLGLLRETGDGDFELTTLGAPLRSDVVGSVRAAALFLAGEPGWRSWGELGYSVRTGKPAFDRVFGMSNFEYWEHNSEAGAIHDAYFQAMAATTNEAIVAAFDFSRFGTIVDVGGSTGSLLAAILRAYPGVRGVLFDLPHVVSGAGPVLAEAGVVERCETVGGSFFESVPGGSDAYLLKYVIHDWDDERSAAILKRCREATGSTAVLLIIEQVLPERIEPNAAGQRITRLDLQMLVMTPGGRERTESEFRSLLREAGFELRSTWPTNSPFSILEAVPVSRG